MPKHVLLNNIDHKDLKVINRYAEKYGHNTSAVATLPTEFADVQREYPILFRENEDKTGYQSIALLGLVPGENLFLDESGWNARYVPALFAKGPFLIGFQEQEVEGERQKEPVIHIDVDDPRVNETEGHPLFLEHGGNSPYLERVANTLKGIHRGLEYSAAMLDAFKQFDLIESVDINVEVHRDENLNLRGFYTISEERLYNLDGASLESLNKGGFLQAAFLVIASLANVKTLIEMKRRRLIEQSQKEPH